MPRPLDHVFLLAVCANTLPIRTLYSHWVRKTLDDLRATVSDIDLTPHNGRARPFPITRMAPFGPTWLQKVLHRVASAHCR